MSGGARGPALSENRLARLGTLSALYFAQGVPWGFIAVGYVVFLSDQKLDNAAIGDAVGLAYVPWSFKILAGPLLDRVGTTRFGRRRPFIVAAQLMMGLSLLALLGVDGRTQLGLVGAILFVHNAFAALQDVATDALAVEVLPVDERGKANSLMWAAKNVGVAVGGGGGTIVAKHFGWPSLFVLNALVIWAVMLLVVAVRERPQGAEDLVPPKRLDGSEIKRSFAFATPLLGIVVAMMAPAGYALTSTVLLRLLRVDAKLGEEQIALLSGTVDPLASVGGALVGGVLADRIGVRKAMGGTMAIVGVALGVFAGSSGHWGQMGFLIGFTVVCTSAFAAYSAAALGFFMTLSNPAIAATQFALYMAATNLTYAWTSPVGGRIADRWGPSATFAVGATMQIAMIGLLFFVDPKRAEARFRAARDVDVEDAEAKDGARGETEAEGSASR